MNKYLEVAQRATEQLIHNAEAELENAKYGGEFTVGIQRYLGGLRQVETVYNTALRKMQEEEDNFNRVEIITGRFSSKESNIKTKKRIINNNSDSN